MKKLTKSVLAVVLSASFSVTYAQKAKVDTAGTKDIEGVVVTALGIKREKKSIGYAAQDINGDVLSKARQNNAVSALSGNVAGVQVTAPSTMGGSSRIVIRGIGSVTGENRPLIVVDGVPLDNSNYNSTSTQRGGGGRDYGDASFDINPDDIETVTVLKGGPAAALYGARAGNGVILYTTKSGKKGKTEITLNSGVSFESIYKYPNLQKEYGGGFGPFEQVNINGKNYNVAYYAMDESWGPKYDPNVKYLPWNAFDPEFADDYLKEIPWVAPKNDVDSYFETGANFNNGVSFSKGFQGTNIRVSFNNNKIEGILPNSTLTKNNFAINVNSDLSEKVKIESSLNYVLTKGFNRPEQGYSDNSVAQKFFQWGQRQLDMSKLRDYKLANGSQRTWNRVSWDDATPMYSDNPYWTAYENVSNDKRQRVFGNFGLTYKITKNLYAVGNIYGDVYSLYTDERVAIGSQAQPYYSEALRNFSEYNFEGRLHWNTKFSDFSLNTMVGANRRDAKYNSVSGTTVGGMVIPNFYSLSNSVSPAQASNYKSWRRVNSVFGMASLGWKDMLYLEATGRNDWFSTVTEDVFYPSLTGSFVFSQVFKPSWLSFGKVRAGWAKVGNDTNPYNIETYVDARTPFQGNPRYSNPTAANNPNLKPELKTTMEVGLEMKLFNNRFGFDVTAYDVKTNDLITPLEVDPATGFGSKWVNAGELENKGIEATVFVSPIKTNDFSWDITWNFAKVDNTLNKLYEDVQTLQLTTAPFKARLIAEVGNRYGQIYGTDYVYDANGNRLVDANGRYIASAVKALGSIVPDYNMGLRNTINYKNFNLSFLIDRQKGGSYYSTSHMWGMYSGMIEPTVANGVRENGIILPGVFANGTPNNKVISAQRWGADHYSRVDAQNVFDASYWKLRDVTLSYSLPKSLLGDSVQGVTFSIFGRNLLTWGLAWKGMDPEMASYGSGNIQGIEGGSLPSTRIYGFNAQIKF